MTSPQKKPLRVVKLGRLFAEAKKRGIDGDQLRNEIAPAQIGKRISKANNVEIESLTRFITGVSASTHPRMDQSSGAKLLMSGYKERYDELGHRDGFATPRQLRKIESMWMDVSRMPNHTAKQKALEGFLNRLIGVDNLRFVEDWQVQKVIKAIEQMGGKH